MLIVTRRRGNGNPRHEEPSPHPCRDGRPQEETRAGEEVAEREPPCPCGRGRRLVWPPREPVWRRLKKLKTELPYGAALLLLGTRPEEVKSPCGTDSCPPLFPTASFPRAKAGTQPKCPLLDEWARRRVHAYNAISLGRKKEGNPAIWDHVEAPGAHHGKLSSILWI